MDSATAHDEECKKNLARAVDHKAHLVTVERKHAAFKDWTVIEEMFGVFRDRYVEFPRNTFMLTSSQGSIKTDSKGLKKKNNPSSLMYRHTPNIST